MGLQLLGLDQQAGGGEQRDVLGARAVSNNCFSVLVADAALGSVDDALEGEVVGRLEARRR